jgi:hypothetical protein
MFLAVHEIALLFGINLLIQMKAPWFTIELVFSRNHEDTV